MIARDNSLGTTSKSFSFTVTGLKPALVVFPFATTVSSVTYNGISMTQSDVQSFGGGNMYTYTLLNPAVGSNTIVVTSPDASITCTAGSWTGVDQVNGINVVANAQSGGALGVNTNFTTTKDGCLAIGNGFVVVAPGGQHINATGSNYNLITSVSGNNTYAIGDSNGSLGNAGAYSQGFSITGVTPRGVAINTVTLVPAALQSIGGAFLMNFL